MNRTFGIKQSLLLCALALLVASGCGQETPPPENGLASQGSALTQDHVIPTGEVCAPTGAHGKHAPFSCTTCHVCGGVLQFDPNGPAVGAGQPPPSFDATAKTCSNVACHSVPSGTFTYAAWDWGCDCPVEVSVPYGGSGGNVTPSWYTTGGAGCIGCHGNPPVNYTWHGSHGGGNQCELCHLDAVSSGGVATGLNPAMNCGPNRNQSCAAFHANGTLDVTPQFKSSCIGCH
jgi:predicted CxxxxCH...CXXCH cytochrome family protein